MTKLLPSASASLEREHSPERNAEIFERAYGANDAPFDRVCRRLDLGFSVLVYLPGNCMDAASRYVMNRLGGSAQWKEFGKHPGGGKSIADAWNEFGSFTDALREWLQGSSGNRPRGIYHNLDLLSDGRGGIVGHVEALTAFFSLVEGTRQGVVLGLSDRDAGALPERLESAFSEKVWLDEIAFDQFPRIIPLELGKKIQDTGSDTMSDGSAWLIASRLRWSDPLRAVQIMRDAASSGTALSDILTKIWRDTRTVEFLDPEQCFPGRPDRIKGFPPETLDQLRTAVVHPFQQWVQFAGSQEACESMLAKLPPGLILYGPPGTGKTYLARWLARSMGLPVRLVTGAQIKASLYGDAEKSVHRLFREARRAAPCLLVFDDADDVLPARARLQGSVASADLGVVNAFLQELEGFTGRPAGVLVLLTTNRFDSLDPAAQTRLPLHVEVPFPLDAHQVGEIVDATTEVLRFELTSQVRAALIGRFLNWVKPRPDLHVPIDTPADRRTIVENLFSPRDILSAMRLLGSQEGMSSSCAMESGRYTPTAEDVDRLESYYTQVSDRAEKKPRGGERS
jgi:hypothetical protein